MSPRRAWARAAIVLALALLLAGRWAAVATADRLWADSVGAGATHGAIATLKLTLLASAFALAGVWALGNLYFVYRAIRSVHVPRRLGNLEILEAVPRRYLGYGAVALGVLIAAVLSHGADSWWYPFALLGNRTDLSLRDPVLGHDIAYYLFQLPWARTLQGYAATSTAVMLAVTTALYGLVGAIRVESRRLDVAGAARVHLGALLTVFAVVLAVGFRLEPAEYVAGMRGVPYDAVLLEVRLPVSHMLSAVAFAVAAASMVWVWIDRVVVVVVAWAALAGFALVGTFVAPAVSAAMRTPEQVSSPRLVAAQRHMLAVAYGLPREDTTITPPVTPAADLLAQVPAELRLAPIWDAATVTDLLDRVAAKRYERFVGVGLDVYRTRDSSLVPVYIGVRTVDLLAARGEDPSMTWASVHTGAYSHTAGAVAVAASITTASGLPLFLPDVMHPESATANVEDLRLTRRDVFFAPSAEDYALVDAGSGQSGIRPGGVLSRLALAWALQSPRLLSTEAFPDDEAVLWRRDVDDRLQHYAPFARFGSPWAVVTDGRLEWLSWGYVAAEGFPLSVLTTWRGNEERYFRASLLGRVDAYTGATAVYLVGRDPLSVAWATVAPALVRPREELPVVLRSHLRYPSDLFTMQATLAAAEPMRGLPAVRFETRSELAGPTAQARSVPKPSWLVGSLPVDDTLRVRLRWGEERGDPPSLAAVVDGSTADGAVLRVERLSPPPSMLGPAEFASHAAAGLDPTSYSGGPVRLFLLGKGIVMLRSIFARPSADSLPPTLHEVVAGAGSILGRGPDPVAALHDLEVGARMGARPASDWNAARRLFRRLDAARRSGDWVAFGRAYDELRRLLVAPHDSVP